MQPVEVIARFDADGVITPLRLRLDGRELSVDAVGRRWRGDDGLHILVMVVGSRVYELVYRLEDSTWLLKDLRYIDFA